MSCATTQFRLSSSRRSSTSKTNQKGVEKKKGRIVSQLRATSWHTTRQETIEPGQLTAIFGTAEIIKGGQKSSEGLRTEEPGWEQFFCRCGKKLDGLTAVQEKTAQVPIEKVQLRLTEKVRRGNAMARQKIRHIGQWIRCRRPNHQTTDLFRRLCGSLGKTRKEESYVHRRTFTRLIAKLGRSSERRTRWSCRIPSTASIT